MDTTSAADLLPEEVKKQLGAFDAALTEMEEEVKKVLTDDFREEEAEMGPLGRAKVHVVLAQAINSLFSMYLRTQGIHPDDHPAKKEAKRLQAYLDKVKKASDRDFQLKNRPAASIDVASANRFITGAIPELTPDQKRRLREAGGGGAGKGAEGGAGGGAWPGRGGGARQAGRPTAAAAAGAGGVSAREAADSFLGDLAGGKRGAAGGGGGKGKKKSRKA